jgi:hypothetical protein
MGGVTRLGQLRRGKCVMRGAAKPKSRRIKVNPTQSDSIRPLKRIVYVGGVEALKREAG